MWTYSQSTGNLTEPSGTIIGTGYSGHGAGVDNPADEQIPDVGPLPVSSYTIGPFFNDPGGKGPLVAHLTPCDGTVEYGRSGFMIHGDNTEANHSASEGCIILAHPLRLAIAQSGDNSLEVTT